MVLCYRRLQGACERGALFEWEIQMTPQVILRVASLVVILGAAACDNARTPTEPAQAFTGTWVGVKRLVSCSPAGPMCDLQRLGIETYFFVRLNQQGDAVDGSVTLSEPGPLTLPYGFFIKGQISPSGQLTFERYFTFDVGEPPYSGDFSIKGSLTRQLIGRMTKETSGSDNITLVWETVALRQ